MNHCSPKASLPYILDMNGNVVTRVDLPKPHTIRRWVASRKYLLVMAVQGGLITRPEVLQQYEISEEEFGMWESEYKRHGLNGLKVTRIQTRKKQI